jgi:hypothetical protein
VGILKFLKATNLNQFAMCSRRCNQAGNDRVLDPTQTGFVTVKTKGAAYVNLLDAILCGEWNNHPRSANWMRLILYGFDKLAHALTFQYKLVAHISRWVIGKWFD